MQHYFDDVRMQMVARTYGDEYNSLGPPKRVEFIMAYVLQLIDRPGRPHCAVERYISAPIL